LPAMTITEALAELKVIDKRIQKKREFVGAYMLRLEQLRDPLEKDGGSVSAIQREMQAIGDLEENKVAIRRAIQVANEATTITVGRATRSIADWLVWRRDVAPGQRDFLTALRTNVERNRQEAVKRGQTAVAAGEQAKPNDVVINVNEQQLATRAEELEAALETLDGQLSLKNATVTVEW
jgi:hypothetical protein